MDIQGRPSTVRCNSPSCSRLPSNLRLDSYGADGRVQRGFAGEVPAGPPKRFAEIASVQFGRCCAPWAVGIMAPLGLAMESQLAVSNLGLSCNARPRWAGEAAGVLSPCRCRLRHQRGLSSRYSSCALASGHSPAVMLYITVSRTVPSRRTAWWRITPSLRAPRRSMAFCEAKL